MPVGRSCETTQTKLAAWMGPFHDAFTAPTWQHVLVLMLGTIITPGRRTVAAALRVTGLDQEPHVNAGEKMHRRVEWPLHGSNPAVVRP